MKRRIVVLGVMLLFLFGGKITAAAEQGYGLGSLLRERGLYSGQFAGKEMWRRELGRERSLLLYIDEKGEYHMCFTDGPWVYLTEDLAERVKEAGLRLWESGGI